MTRPSTALAVAMVSGFLAGCPTPTNNGNNNANLNGMTEAAVPKGSDCGAIVIACYDEFARQPANVICFREQSRWGGTDLTWRLADVLPGFDDNQQTDVARRAFDLWAAASALNFSRADGDTADITISFSTGDHGDPFPFDGPGDNLGHAFFPGSGNPGAVHLCAAEDWGLTAGSGSFDLFTAMVHEIGHALGLEHSLDADAVMAPSYAGAVTALTPDDIAAVQRLYGSADGSVPPIIEQGEAFEAFCADVAADLTALGDPDTDGDGIPDTIEVFVLDTQALQGDTDGDDVSDFTEVFVDTTDPVDQADFNPASVVAPPPESVDDALTAKLFVDGSEIVTFQLGDDSFIAVAPGGLDGQAFQILIQSGGFDFAQVSQIVILFNNASDITGNPIPASGFQGLLQLAVSAPQPVVAQACRNFQDNLNGNACFDDMASGTIDLVLAGGRLVGSFDFSITSSLGNTLRAVGDLNLPETFAQTSPLMDPGGGFDLPGIGG